MMKKKKKRKKKKKEEEEDPTAELFNSSRFICFVQCSVKTDRAKED
jgi:hypothetical protein